MYRILIAHLVLFFLLCSCKKKNKDETEAQGTNHAIQSTIKANKAIVSLNAKATDLVKTWPEYQNFNDLIDQYQEITVSEALLNSVELSELAQQLKDSIRVDKLNIPEVKIRLNVLHSETLRLADMSSIPTITQESVEAETNNMLDAFSALNLKINNMNLQEELNEEISKFVDEVLESPTIDTTNSPIYLDSLQ